MSRPRVKPSSPIRRFALTCFARRRLVLTLWLCVLVGCAAGFEAVGSDYKNSFTLKNTESAQAIALVKAAAPRQSGDSDQVVFSARSGRVTDPASRSRANAVLGEIAKLPHVGAVASPFAAGGRRQVSRDGTVAYATVTFDESAGALPKAAVKKVIMVADQARLPSLDVALGGQAIEQVRHMSDGGTAEGVIAALVVLLLVFGSLLAAVLPLLTAGFALGIGICIVGLLSHVITMAPFSSQLALLIGLGVGVDYALFIVTRYRQALSRGADSAQAVAEAMDTSGRAVLFAGATVCIALLGMFALGVTVLDGAAVAASIVVAFTVLAAVTLLPALLGFFGTRTLTRKQRGSLGAGRLNDSDESLAWSRWAGVLQRRPGAAVVLATLAMLAIAVPFLSLRLGASDAGLDPSGSTTRQAYDALARGFGPGFNGPLQLVAKTSGVGDQARFRRLTAAVARTADVASVTSVRELPGGVDSALVIPRGSPQDASTTRLVDRIRNTVVPRAAGGLDVKVGGQTAIFEDFSSTISGKLPLFVVVVVALSFLLLMAAFRSLVVPAMAAVMNLLSVGAAFGVTTAVFQHGWGASVIGVDRTGPIEAFVPVIIFAVLFGLSMDYEVFLMSRIYEEWHQRRDNREAVVHGLAATGRTITAAAAIMVLVFAAFVLGGERLIKVFGLGLASAVFLDAVVVRSILVPGLLLAIGKANWWLPGWLRRGLPAISIEGAPPTQDRDGASGRSAREAPV